MPAPIGRSTLPSPGISSLQDACQTSRPGKRSNPSHTNQHAQPPAKIPNRGGSFSSTSTPTLRIGELPSGPVGSSKESTTASTVQEGDNAERTPCPFNSFFQRRLQQFITPILSLPDDVHHLIPRIELERKVLEILETTCKGTERRSSVLIYGPYGCGKHSVVRNVVGKILMNAHQLYPDKAIYQIDAKTIADAPSGISAIFDAIPQRSAARVIVILENSDQIFSSLFLAEGLPSVLDRYKNLQIIALSSGNQSKILSLDPIFEGYFQHVQVEEMSDEMILRVLEEKYPIRKEFLYKIVKLAERYFPKTNKLRRSMELTSSCKAYARVREKEFTSLSEEVIYQIVSERKKIPVSHIREETERPLEYYRQELAKVLTGQGHIIDAMVDDLASCKVGLNNPHKPVMVYAFPGADADVNRAIAKKVAEILYDTGDHVLRLDMRQFSDPDAKKRLFGFESNTQPGLLTRQLLLNSSCVVLLENLEEAHTDVHEIFFDAFETGELALFAQRPIACTSVSFILTTKVGSNEVEQNQPLDVQEVTRRVVGTMVERFNERVHQIKIYPFLPPNQEVLFLAIEHYWENLALEPVFKKNNMTFSWTKDLAEQLVQQACREKKSVMAFIAGIDREVRRLTARFLLMTTHSEGAHLEYSLCEGKLRVGVKSDERIKE